MRYVNRVDKITRVITSCVSRDQLVVAQVYCNKLIHGRVDLDTFFELNDLITKLISTQSHVISKS